MVNFSMTWFSWHICFALKIFSMGYVHHYQYQYVHWCDHVMISTQVLYTHKVVNRIARRHYPEEQKNHINIQSWVWLANLSCWPLVTLGDPWGSSTPTHTWLVWKSWRVKTPWASRSLRPEDVRSAHGQFVWPQGKWSTYFNMFQHVSTHPRFVTKHQQCQCIFVADMFCWNGVCGELARLRKRIA